MLLLFIVNKKEPFQTITNLNGIHSFDGYFYINLEHRKDRKKQITNELNKMKIPINKIVRVNAIRNKRNGHIGCCKSHIKALNNALTNNYKYTMILEDDFIFTKSKAVVDKKMSISAQLAYLTNSFS